MKFGMKRSKQCLHTVAENDLNRPTFFKHDVIVPTGICSVIRFSPHLSMEVFEI